MLVAITAHDYPEGAAPPSGTDMSLRGLQDTAPITADNPLGVSWCGLDDTQHIAGAWILYDTGAKTVAGEIRTAQLELDATGHIAVADASDNVLSYLSADLKTALAELMGMGNNFSDFRRLQAGDIVRSADWLLDSGTFTPVATVPDLDGGFVLPMRNRFVMNGKIGGYTLSFCAITQIQQYAPFSASGVWPIYTTKAAALSDTAFVNGTRPEPHLFRLNSSAIDYFVPAMPVSTQGLICAPQSYRTAWGSTQSSARFGEYGTNVTCTLLIDGFFSNRPPPPASGGRRSLMQVARQTIPVQPNIRTGASVHILPEIFTVAAGSGTNGTTVQPVAQQKSSRVGVIVASVVAGSVGLVALITAGVYMSRRNVRDSAKKNDQLPETRVGYRFRL